jgi:leader peptidase (prepilin peptidase) / N-methyltransferase
MSSSMLLLLAGVLGLCVGSFLNVCIHRLPRRESLLWPASRCPRCGTSLRWVHNVPLVSWIALRGRCASCRAPISAQYPVVELVTALLWVLIVWWTPAGPLLASRLVLATILIVLFAIDLEHQILPNVITLPGILVGLAFSLVAPPGLPSSLLGMLLGGGVLYAIAAGYYLVRKEEGMGMGDVKMLAMIGAFLGWRAVLVTLVLASFAGAAVGLALMATHRGTLRYALPFGTFLSFGALVAMLVGDRLIDWYAGFYPPL